MSEVSRTEMSRVRNNGEHVADLQKQPAQGVDAVVVTQRAVEAKRLEIVHNWSGSLPPKLAYQLAKLSVAYGLDPFLGELVILADKVYPTVAAILRKANENPNFDGEETRPATDEERKEFYKPFPPPDDEYLWRCAVYVKGKSRPFVGWGRASAKNVKMSTMQTWLPEMAQKRARGRAYRLAFNIGLPTIEEMWEFEDGTVLHADPEKQVDLAEPELIDKIFEEILTEQNRLDGLITDEEWERTVEAMNTVVSRKRAESLLTYFLGPKWDGKGGEFERRRMMKHES